jgi:hypothetical protein
MLLDMHNLFAVSIKQRLKPSSQSVKQEKSCVAINEDWIIAACILLAAQQLIKQNISALILICMNYSMSEGQLSSMPPAASDAKQAQF